MGAPIAHQLIADGFEVSVWDRSTDRAAALVDAGARLASSPAEAAEGAAVVLTMLMDGEAVAAARTHQIEFVDAPVSGGDGPAREGKLVVLASGPEGIRPLVEPVFDAIGQKTVWLGPAGYGTRLKLVLNNWLVSQVEAVAETIALTEALGLDPRLFIETVGDGPLASPYAMAKAQAMVDGEDLAAVISVASPPAGAA